MDRTPTMTLEQNQDWLDYCLTFCDLQSFEPKGPAQRRALEDIHARRASPNRRRMQAVLDNILPADISEPQPPLPEQRTQLESAEVMVGKGS